MPTMPETTRSGAHYWLNLPSYLNSGAALSWSALAFTDAVHFFAPESYTSATEAGSMST